MEFCIIICISVKGYNEYEKKEAKQKNLLKKPNKEVS